MRYNKFVYLCTILGSHTSWLSNVLCVTFKARWTMVFIYTCLLLGVSLPTLIPNGLVVRLLDDPLPVIMCFLVRIFSLGRQNDNVRFLDLVPKQSIGVLRMSLRRHVGFVTCYVSSFIPLLLLPWSTMIMLVRFICLQTLFSTNVLNISRSTFILFVIK